MAGLHFKRQSPPDLHTGIPNLATITPLALVRNHSRDPGLLTVGTRPITRDVFADQRMSCRYCVSRTDPFQVEADSSALRILGPSPNLLEFRSTSYRRLSAFMQPPRLDYNSTGSGRHHQTVRYWLARIQMPWLLADL